MDLQKGIMMSYAISEEKGLYFLRSGKNYVTTPSGNRLSSHHLPLMREIAKDAEAWGTDPTAATSMVSLQSSYLDFGLRFLKEDMLNDFLDGWKMDIFFQRSADPEFLIMQSALYGPLQNAGDSLVSRIRSFNLRQLMASIVCKMNMGSAVVAAMVVADIRGVYESARGLCTRHVTHHMKEIMQNAGGILIGGNPAELLYVPEKYDETLCKKCLQDNDTFTEEMFLSKCGVTIVLDKVKRFSTFPEDK